MISRWVICGGSAAPISESRRDFRKRSEVFGIEQRALRVAGVVHRLRAAWRTEPLERALSFPAINVEIVIHLVKKASRRARAEKAGLQGVEGLLVFRS